MFNLTGKRALVVGGAGEIGHAIAEALLEFGASVVIVDKDLDTLNKAEALNEKWSDCFGYSVDISDRDQIDESIGKAVQFLGGSVEILVNAAGIQRRNSSEIFSDESIWRNKHPCVFSFKRWSVTTYKSNVQRSRQ